jgi:hypothetical protein
LNCCHAHYTPFSVAIESRNSFDLGARRYRVGLGMSTNEASQQSFLFYTLPWGW